MSWRLAAAFVTTLLAVAVPAVARASDADRVGIREALTTMFDAAREDDLEKFRSVVAPEFDSFDAGARLTGDELMRLIKEQHAKGWVYEWNLQEPEIRLHGETALASYVNSGFVQDPAGMRTAVTWLESAFLRRHEGRWLISFFHSSRAK
jgi:Calcium/calmodulin dependent protein kinase II association domain